MELAAATVWGGRFAIDGRPLGSGATGVVWPATDLATGRAVAVQVVHPHLAGDLATSARLQDAARIAGRLRHRHVVEVLGVWSDAGTWLLVSERIDGVQLAAHDVPIEPRAVAALGLELAEALAAAHEAGIVHGDVRPGNVLLGSQGAFLFDFGGAGAGTVRPGESAPEVLAGGAPTPVADLYGLGVVLHRAWTGRMPFAGAVPWALATRQAEGWTRPPQGPRGLVEVIGALLSPDPTDRPPSAAIVAEVLRTLAVDPRRRARGLRPRLAPLWLTGAWVVHGIDPSTGAPAWFASGLRFRDARARVARLRALGWTATATREALGPTDLVVAGGAAVAGGLVVPVFGALPAGWLALRWRNRAVRPHLRRVLPPVAAQLPPRVAPAGTESALVAALLLLLCGAALAWWPVAALAPGALLVLLGAWSLSRRGLRIDPAELARDAHVGSAVDEVRARIESAPLPLDTALALLGEVEAIEADWHGGTLEADAALVRIDAVRPQTLDPR